MRSEKKQPVDAFINKVIQLLETMIIRHGNMIVGSTGTGKTSVSRILGKSLSLLYEERVEQAQGWYKKTTIATLNPKAVTKGELYGESNVYTNEW